MPPVTRRAFLKLTAVAASAVTFARLLPGKAAAAVRACIPVLGTEVPLMVPMMVGDDCAPPPTATDTATATLTPTLTASAATQTATVTPSATATASSTPTASASPTATPSATATVVSMRTWFPLVLKHLPDG